MGSDPQSYLQMSYEMEHRKCRERIAELEAWVNDLHSGMYINCVYCGHRYGPDPGTPVAMADVLKAHIELCPKHPMSAMKRERDEAQASLAEERARLDKLQELVLDGAEVCIDDKLWNPPRIFIQKEGCGGAVYVYSGDGDLRAAIDKARKP